MRAFPVAIALLLALAGPAGLAGETRSLQVRVIGVSDGDTLVVLDSNELQHRVRLAGIDAPEKGQPFGDRSRRALSDLVYGKTVTMQWSKKDGYGRLVAKVLVDEPQRDVNLAQVSAGLAWHYKQFEKEQTKQDRLAYASAEQLARDHKDGLWSQPDPVEPWNWRHGKADGPVRKSRNQICHSPDMASYSSVKDFTAYATLQACIDSGGRLPRG